MFFSQSNKTPVQNMKTAHKCFQAITYLLTLIPLLNVAGNEWEIAYGTTDLTLGSRGRYATRLQTDLSNAGYNPGPIDGKYGSATRNAVYDFQSDNNLGYDGIAGPETKAALY